MQRIWMVHGLQGRGEGEGEGEKVDDGFAAAALCMKGDFDWLLLLMFGF